MLGYLMNMANDLFALGVVIGFVFAYLEAFYGLRGKKVFKIGFIVSLLVACIRSILMNSFRFYKSWVVGMSANFIAVIGFFVVVIATIVFSIKKVREKLPLKWQGRIDLYIMIAIMVTLGAFIFRATYNAWYYPINFYYEEIGILSTEYLMNLLGYVIGLVMFIAIIIVSYKVGSVLHKKGFDLVLKVSSLIVFAAYSICVFFILASSMIVRNMIKSQILFQLSIKSKNNEEWYTYILLALLIVLCVFLIVKSFTVKETYKNNAEYRKKKAVWRSAKRGVFVGMFGLVLFVLCQTYFVVLTTEIIVDAEIEDPIIVQNGAGEDEYLWVNFALVNDTHLHKFEYTTADGYKTRFVVILKVAGTTNYGVGLDACEICGEAGYYENSDNQVVCKKCGVVMNTMTIGMKGGCNPIVIDYDLDESKIIVPVSEMVKHQEEFSK